MKNIKEITISIFAIIGFFTIITGFTNNTETATQQTYGTPESHVWEFHLAGDVPNGMPQAFSINKVTGEVRKYGTNFNGMKNAGFGDYRITQEHLEK